MAKIDIQQWGNFKVKDVFETNLIGKTLQVPTGAMVERKNLREGDIPRVTVSNFNNGITGYYADIDDSNYRVYENFISVSFLGTVFYQPSRASLDMKVHCLKLKDRSYNVNIAEYLVTVVRNAIKNFMYADQLSSTVLPDLEIQLPVNQNGKPDWEYMDSYMSKVLRESEASLENLRQASTLKRQIDTTEWKEFVIGDLFCICRPCSRSQSNYENGDIPFVASGNFNNGVVKWCQPTLNDKLDKGNCLTVSPVDGSSFYQKVDFLGRGGAGSAILILQSEHLNEMRGLFISVIIRRVTCKHSYSDQINSQTLSQQKIKLPANANDEPDWEYMDNFMSRILEQSEYELDNFLHRKLH